MNTEIEIKIRHATTDDILAILHLERVCPTAAHWSEAQYADAFRSDGPERIVLIAERKPNQPADGQTDAVGFLVARHIPPDWELENIVVAPEARRKGVGKQLLQALLAHASETNSESVFLEVRESNAAARSLYEKAGFQQAGMRKSYYASPSEAAILYRGSASPKPFSE